MQILRGRAREGDPPGPLWPPKGGISAHISVNIRSEMGFQNILGNPLASPGSLVYHRPMNTNEIRAYLEDFARHGAFSPGIRLQALAVLVAMGPKESQDSQTPTTPRTARPDILKGHDYLGDPYSVTVLGELVRFKGEDVGGAAETDLNPAQARELATWLNQAADYLEASDESL